MPPGLLGIVALALGLVGVALCLAGVVALLRARPLRFALRTLSGLLLLALGMLAGTLALGVHGFQALTHEALAARLVVQPTGAQRYTARVRFPDGRESSFELAGDEILVDAHILKWRPLANLLGLHTAYQLDRISGRYRDIEQERSAPRTVYPLSAVALVDLVSLRRRFPGLGRLFDAEYGSAAYVPVTGPAQLELRVSTTGLLLREAPSEGR